MVVVVGMLVLVLLLSHTSFQVSAQGSHCDHHWLSYMHHMSSGQHVSPVKPEPPHCAYFSLLQVDGDGEAGMVVPADGEGLGAGAGEIGKVDAAMVVVVVVVVGMLVLVLLLSHTSFQVSAQGSHCDHHWLSYMHHMSSGQHVSPVKPEPPHCAYFSLLQVDGDGEAGKVVPADGEGLGPADGEGLGTKVSPPKPVYPWVPGAVR